MKPLYREIALAISAYRRCDENYLSATDGTPDEQHWHNMRRMHQDKIKALVKAHMPSGSGFDQGTRLDFDYSNECKLVFNTSFHHMNEQGSYDGWTDHRVTVKPSLKFEFELTVSGPDRNQIKDMVHDTFYCALRTDLEPAPKPRVVIDISGGAIHGTWSTQPVDVLLISDDSDDILSARQLLTMRDGSKVAAYYQTPADDANGQDLTDALFNQTPEDHDAE